MAEVRDILAAPTGPGHPARWSGRASERPRQPFEAATCGASTLTLAELRVLPLLTTHLTFREIGERLFVSQNTVKTQAISIYRKLDATSRSEAIDRAVAIGLLECSRRLGAFHPRRDDAATHGPAGVG